MRRIRLKLFLPLIVLLAINGLLLGAAPAESTHPEGICYAWGGGDHCSCEPYSGSLTNCHLDEDCEDVPQCDGAVE